MSFTQAWTVLQSKLTPGTTVSNWTAHKGLLGDSFLVIAVGKGAVEVSSPNARTVQKIPEQDFATVYGMWSGYLAGTIKRPTVRDSTRCSKYVISIFRWLEQVRGVPLP